MAVLLSSTPRWPTPLTVTATTAAWAGTERTGGRPCRISRRLPATARLPALACGLRPRRTPERGAKGDDGVLAGEATACDGLRSERR
jgi:hypothetical protein